MCVPSFHVGGMLGLLVNLYGGDTTVIQPRFDAGGWLALVARHHVVTAFVVGDPPSLDILRDAVKAKLPRCASLLSLRPGGIRTPPDSRSRAPESSGPEPDRLALSPWCGRTA